MLDSLTIVTITFDNQIEFKLTYDNLNTFRQFGGRHIIINGGKSIRHIVEDSYKLIEEPDKGIYDALNKGINLVDTKYLMLIHSGDTLAVDIEVLNQQIILMEKLQLDILLNNCTIAAGKWKRLMSSKNWKPWMFKFGAQPPHPPIIYKKESISIFKYDLRYPIIADFDYLERIFQRQLNYSIGNQVLVHMSAGGKTSSGLKSFLFVSREFIELKGIFFSVFSVVTRPFFKLIQMF